MPPCWIFSKGWYTLFLAVMGAWGLYGLNGLVFAQGNAEPPRSRGTFTICSSALYGTRMPGKHEFMPPERFVPYVNCLQEQSKQKKTKDEAFSNKLYEDFKKKNDQVQSKASAYSKNYKSPEEIYQEAAKKQLASEVKKAYPQPSDQQRLKNNKTKQEKAGKKNASARPAPPKPAARQASKPSPKK